MPTRKIPKPVKRKSRSDASQVLARTVVHKILTQVELKGFEAYVKRLLVDLCRIDTTPNADVEKMRAAEDACFRIIEKELAALKFSGARSERRPVNPDIREHPSFSQLHFTKSPERPLGLSPQEAYADRGNLVYLVSGTGAATEGKPVALNAHIDVVAPYLPPRVKGGVIHGRGACDDKGPVVSLVAALKVLSQVMADAGLELNRDVVAMFVIEEETGGNGSLSLAMDPDLKQHYDSVLVGECTGLKFHPANRGAVWYRVELTAPAGASLLEMFGFVNEEMEREGAAIRAESRHPLFPQRPVQTCHGIVGHFGEHPSRICGEVSFEVQFENPPDEKTEALVRDCLEAGLGNYIGLYGDKTKVKDAATGKPMVARHYDLRRTGQVFEIEIHGATGHMGAIRERDGAITKMAHLVHSLVYSKARMEILGGPMRLELGVDPAAPSDEEKAFTSLILEGGQGFVPTHDMEEVKQRLRRAAERGAENYLRLVGSTGSGQEFVRMTYEKLHNAAFDGKADSTTVCNAIAAAKDCGLWRDEPVLGWTVSCDARLFATEYPGMDVLTFGPGQLANAHSDQEQITVKEICAAAAFLAIFLLRQTGTLTSGA